MGCTQKGDDDCGSVACVHVHAQAWQTKRKANRQIRRKQRIQRKAQARADKAARGVADAQAELDAAAARKVIVWRNACSRLPEAYL